MNRTVKKKQQDKLYGWLQYTTSQKQEKLIKQNSVVKQSQVKNIERKMKQKCKMFDKISSYKFRTSRQKY